MRSLTQELKDMGDKLRGIRAPRMEGSGHHFGKSGLSRRARGESDKAEDVTDATE